MRDAANSVEGIERHLALYLDTARQLTAILDQENQLLLFEAGEAQVLGDEARQAAKRALYVRIETLARIVARTMEVGSDEEVTVIRAALAPIEHFRRSLRLNSVLLDVCIERQERRMQRVLRMIEKSTESSTAEVPQCR